MPRRLKYKIINPESGRTIHHSYNKNIGKTSLIELKRFNKSIYTFSIFIKLVNVAV